MYDPRRTFRDARDTVSDGGRYLWDHTPEFPMPSRWRGRDGPRFDRSDAGLALLGLGVAAVVAGCAWYVASSEPRRQRVRRAALRSLEGIGVRKSEDDDDESQVIKKGPASLK
ncbi:hypothetical protein [Amorphus orientalis]|uniref:Uncharacterized protein n=1 Tax=Amorphus orientalis TaxID=649198 RepID=A0AAE3VLU4_9HYPH|nr:hypothetical protein [Amorphus orientalis]MDQ0314417.1 hypothetical protein [Amorphus orientalis]